MVIKVNTMRNNNLNKNFKRKKLGKNVRKYAYNFGIGKSSSTKKGMKDVNFNYYNFCIIKVDQKSQNKTHKKQKHM